MPNPYHDPQNGQFTSADRLFKLAKKVRVFKGSSVAKDGHMAGLRRYYMPDVNASIDTYPSKREGHRYISYATVAPAERGKGYAQALYIRALQDAPIVNRPPISADAQRVRRKLTAKGIAERKGNALYLTEQSHAIVGSPSHARRLGGV